LSIQGAGCTPSPSCNSSARQRHAEARRASGAFTWGWLPSLERVHGKGGHAATAEGVLSDLRTHALQHHPQASNTPLAVTEPLPAPRLPPPTPTTHTHNKNATCLPLQHHHGPRTRLVPPKLPPRVAQHDHQEALRQRLPSRLEGGEQLQHAGVHCWALLGPQLNVGTCGGGGRERW